VIRSSALLTVAAMAMLVAGVFSASLGLIYASIAVSILAAITLGAGVLLRRREIFGGAGVADAQPGWAATDTARAWPAAPGRGTASPPRAWRTCWCRTSALPRGRSGRSAGPWPVTPADSEGPRRAGCVGNTIILRAGSVGR